MSWLEALILGLVQGLTEFLPVSSSGHLEIAKQLLGIDVSDDLTFTVVVHGATVLSTIVVFWQEISKLFGGMFKFKWNSEMQYITMILASMIPVGIMGFCFKDQVESLFNGGLWIVGGALLLTALLLTFANYAKEGHRDINFKDALVIGLAQAVAVIPGLSRSGTTIATGLLLGNKRVAVAQFSFLMVLIPILGENILEMMKGDLTSSAISTTALLVGFFAAFISGWAACKFMVNLVKKGKLIYFAIYCALIAIVAFML